MFTYFFSTSFWTVGAWDTKKPREKRGNPKKQKKTIWNRLTPDSSHRIVFFVSFWFSLTFWTYGKVEMKKGKKHEKTKDAKTQRSQPPFLIILYYIKISSPFVGNLKSKQLNLLAQDPQKALKIHQIRDGCPRYLGPLPWATNSLNGSMDTGWIVSRCKWINVQEYNLL